MSLLPDPPAFTFDGNPAGEKPAKFDSGVDLTPADHVRLTGQIERVYDVLSDGRWHSVPDIYARIVIRDLVRDPEPSISAQIRNLRKARFGGHQIERRRVGNGYEFRLVREER